jgi:hypothetical protein
LFENIDGIEINYEGLSDGEHQLIQNAWNINLIDEPDTLYFFYMMNPTRTITQNGEVIYFQNIVIFVNQEIKK